MDMNLLIIAMKSIIAIKIVIILKYQKVALKKNADWNMAIREIVIVEPKSIFVRKNVQ